MENKTQEALKMAIEAMENTKLGDAAFGLAPSIILDDAINACKEALEQPAQKPVDVARVQVDGSVEWRPDLPDLPVGTKLYTHPYQWQGLTDEHLLGQLFGIRFQRHTENLMSNPPQIKYSYTIQESDLIKFARAIEQALKEKNHV